VSTDRHDLIRGLFDRWNTGDREIDEAAVDPDAEIHSAMTGATYRGYGGIKDWMAEIDDQFESWKVWPEEFRDLPDGSVLVLGQVQIRGRASGVALDQPVAWLIGFAGGRLAEMKIFADHQSALDAAG
jgi:ketosteroid isomerase-like protein